MKLTSRIASFITTLILVLATVSTTVSSRAKYDYYLLSCGASGSVANTPSTWDGRTWYSDNNSTFSTNITSTAGASIRNPSIVTQIPFSTARIFASKFTYYFPVSPGPKFIRLFFNPSGTLYWSSSNSSTPLSLSAADAYLTVEANSDHLLLHNFSAYMNSNNSDCFFKEFYINQGDSPLQLTFSPTTASSYAFVNGIEVVSVPENLYVGPNTLENYGLLPTTALENAYRVNVGGSEVGPMKDNGNMQRKWEDDDQYLSGAFRGLTGLPEKPTDIKYATNIPNYSAPVTVYQSFRSFGFQSNTFKRTASLTWEFEVDLGFNYLVRLHWCEIVSDINAEGYRIFDVYMDHQMEEAAVDIFDWVGGDTAVYKDYVLYMDGGEGSGKGVFQLALRPNITRNPQYYDVLLNGLEIFKINRPDGSLNASNPIRLPVNTFFIDAPSPRSSSSHTLPATIGAFIGVILLGILIYFIITRRLKLSKSLGASSGTTSNKSNRLLSSGKSETTKRRGGDSSSLPSHLCQYFSLAEIKLATSDFSDSLIIGHGGFGNVYKGTVISEDGPITVAIKRLNPLSNQGAREFKMEIELLSKLRHLHLVSLIGYCDASGEMILVYEYMSNGTLRDHLYPHNKITNAQLPWLRRLQICVGAARGLHYLHTGNDRMVIHRDVKSTNILLDERWVAKVSDFGLSKLGPAGGDLVSHVSTAVKGSFGYVDPEYYRRQQLTEKSDVYSFGVVLFEVLCGRAAVNPNLPKEQVNLRIWARRNHLTGTLNTIVDPTLMGQIATECLRKFGDVAESCVRDEGVLRPSMADVIGGLELALQLQLEALVPKNINQLSSRTTMTSATDQGVTDENTLDEDYQVATTNITSPTTDASVRLIRSPGESTWTSVNNSSRLFSSTTSEAYGGSPEVFSQIFKADGR